MISPTVSSNSGGSPSVAPRRRSEGGTALSQLWAFWLAPIVGAAIAGLVYVWLRPEDAANSGPVSTPAEA